MTANSESFRLAPWAGRRRRDLLELPDRWIETITELSQGDRAAESATVGAYITKQGSSRLRLLLVGGAR